MVDIYMFYGEILTVKANGGWGGGFCETNPFPVKIPLVSIGFTLTCVLLHFIKPIIPSPCYANLVILFKIVHVPKSLFWPLLMMSPNPYSGPFSFSPNPSSDPFWSFLQTPTLAPFVHSSKPLLWPLLTRRITP